MLFNGQLVRGLEMIPQGQLIALWLTLIHLSINPHKTLKKLLTTLGRGGENAAGVFSYKATVFFVFHALSVYFISMCPLGVMPPPHIVSLSYLGSYLCSLSPSNCFSTASLAEELQLFNIQLPVQPVSSSRILIKLSPPMQTQCSLIRFSWFARLCVCVWKWLWIVF